MAAMIMIKCPKTGTAVPTGMGSDKQSFATTTYTGNVIGKCPACGLRHTWDKKDAWVQE